jgi:hypothetical protein
MMGKFFVQMLLSVMVGVGAALGLSSDVKSELRETLKDANAYLHEHANAIVENVHDLPVGMDKAISTSSSTKVSAENGNTLDVKVNTTLNSKGDAQSSLLNNWFPSLSMDGFFSNKTQTDIETGVTNVDVGLKEKLKSTLGLGLEE